jgi:hypothetical protein
MHPVAGRQRVLEDLQPETRSHETRGHIKICGLVITELSRQFYLLRPGPKR